MKHAIQKDILRSVEFDDVYFSAQDGLAETIHVFLKGNNLPERWQGCEYFTIAETGFGTGLNFLAVWKLFEETAEPAQRLNFISFEKFPLEPEQIRQALKPWGQEFSGFLDAMLGIYPMQRSGIHKIRLDDQVTLTLIFEDVNEALPELMTQIDCWFLDGFKPSSNPEMWSEIVFQNMARLSAPKASFSTFTAAGFVRRGLQAAGFEVQKLSGFGRKREMIAGQICKRGHE